MSAGVPGGLAPRRARRLAPGRARRLAPGRPRALGGCTAAAVALLALSACDVSRPVPAGSDAGTACPRLPTGLGLDSTCEGRRCVLAARQDGCAFELSITLCMSEVLTGRVGPDGTLLFDPSPSIGTCTAVEPRSEVEASFQCDTPHGQCLYDLYAPATRSAAGLEVVSLVSSPFTAPPGQEGEPLEEFDPTTGYLADTLVLDGAVWVATRAGSFGTLECEEEERAELIRIDPETMQETARVIAPPCLARLARDPTAPGQLLGVTAGRAPVLHRFDTLGRSIARRDVPPPALPAPTDDLVPVGLFTGTSTTVALVLTTLQRPGAAWLLTFDVTTLTHRATSLPTTGAVRASAGIDRGRVYVADHQSAAVLPFDVAAASLELGGALALEPARGSSDNAGFVYPHETSGRLLVASTGRRAALWALDPMRSAPAQRAFAYEAELIPWAITGWPGDAERVAVGAMVAPPGFGAVLATFSVAENRFLPGTVRLGTGMVSRLDPDARGRLWATLPWSGQLVRVTP